MMDTGLRHLLMAVLAIFGLTVLTACGGGGSGTSGTVTPPAPPPTPPPPAGEQSITVDSVQRWFNVRRAASVQTGAPLVILLHGGFGNMRQVLEAEGSGEWVDIAVREGILLIAPNGTNVANGDTFSNAQHWNDQRAAFATRDSDADDVSFILAVIDWAVTNHQIDTTQVFVTGPSNGGMMTYRMLSEAPERFAAGAAFIANLPTDNPLITEPAEPVRVMIMVGTDDPLMPFGGGDIDDGGRGSVRSSFATRDWWVDQSGADPVGVLTLLDDIDPGDGCVLQQNDHLALAGGSDIRFTVMDGGGHAIPSTDPAANSNFGPQCRDAEGAELAWEFFVGQ